MNDEVNNDINSNNMEETTKKPKSNRTKIILIVIGIILICCCVTLAFGAYLNSTPEGKITSTARAAEKQETQAAKTEVAAIKETEAAMPTDTAQPTNTLAPTTTPLPTETPTVTSSPEPTSTPILGLVEIGTHIISKDIEVGIYWGLAGYDLFDSCYWARLSDLTGEMGSVLANDNAIGQYYIEIKETDFALETACELILLEHAPELEFGDELDPGTYLIGRDIQPGTFQGQAGDEILNSCYWARLKDVSGGIGSIIANDNATGSYYVQVRESDFALNTGCPLVRIDD